MDRRFWEKILPATVIALGIALAGYFLGGRYVVVPSQGGSAYIVDRFEGTVRKCEEYRDGAFCADMPNWGEYKTPVAEPAAYPEEVPAADAAMAPAADAAAMAPARAAYPDEIPAADAAMAPR
jgi:hypothetical protein